MPRLRRDHLALASLSLASGCLDGLSFLALGDVLTSAMTGNTALLAIAIGEGRLSAAGRSLTALAGFTLAHRDGHGSSPGKVHLATLAAYAFGATLAAFAVSHDVRALIWLPVALVLCALALLISGERQLAS